jgi:flagellin
LTFTSATPTADVTDITVSGSVTLTYSGADGNIPAVSLVRTDGGLLFDGVDKTSATTIREAVTQGVETISNTGKFLQSGSLAFSVPTTAQAGDSVTAVFTTQDNEHIQMTGTLSKLNPATVTFPQSAGVNSTLVSGDLTYTMEDAAGYLDLKTTPRALTVTVGVEGSIPRMREGDLTINGVSVGPSQATDDKLSPRNNAAGSAIAIAAAINKVAVTQGISQGEIQSVTLTGTPSVGTISVGGVSVVLGASDSTPALAAAKIAAALQASPQFGAASGRTVSYASGSATISIGFPPSEKNVANVDVQPGATGLGNIVNTTQEFATQRAGTGVFAKVNENVFSGQSMVSGPIATGTIFINGYATANIATQYNNSQSTRENTVRAINQISDRTGVKAIDTGADAKGIQLVAADGRNIEVRFETTGSTNPVAFGQRLGMREGVQSSTISLESKIQTPVLLGSVPGGDINRAGLLSGDYTKNQAVQNTSPRAPVTASKSQINTVAITTDVAVGNSATIVINGKSYSVQVAAAADPTATPPKIASGKAQDVTTALMNQINADTTVGVYATKGASLGEIALTSRTPGSSFTLSTTSTDAAAKINTAQVQAAEVAAVKGLGTNDLVINGVPIRASRDIDDLSSNTVVSSSDPAASAIAIAAAINDSSTLTGVKAYANPAETAGSVTSTNDPVNGMRSLWVNGTEVKVKFVQDEDPSERRAKVVAAINERTGQHGVVASDNGKGVTLQTSDGRNLSVWFDSSIEHLDAADFGLSKGGEVAQQSTIQIGGAGGTAGKLAVTVNGVAVEADILASDAPDTAAQKLADKINQKLTNLKAVPMADGSIVITSRIPGSSFDIHGPSDASGSRTMSISTDVANSSGKTDVSAVNMTDDYKKNVLGDINAPISYMNIRTLYGTVRMVSEAAVLPTLPGADGITPSSLNSDGRAIQIRVGGDGFSDSGNFRALGLQEGSFGGRASTDMDPPRVGRMAFQVGSSANQYITIDLADFGKKGPITGDITGDVDLSADQRSVRINTREGAQSVLNLLDAAMDKVNSTRATMGAVMNRLDHVINNLNNVSTNLSASRSQVEDADYAKASTDLARAQILQQAATAVLAQANTSQQSVLKLLGNGG